ncbi:MAG: thiamine pyrophosphate-dependent enzyme [Candidatus Bipolaricaulia bacterium]
MIPTIKTLAQSEEREKRFVSGHSLCSGCGIPIVVRTVLNTIEDPVVVVTATGCLEVATTRYPNTVWNVPWLHNAFENAAATMSGIETAYRALKQKGKLDKDGDEKPIRFVVFAGDGGTYDIGLQSLSGALERGHNFLYVCYDNEAYMNTGNQRSGATPFAAHTTTAPRGAESFGKIQRRKDLTEIAVAHHIPYVAQASISHWQDLADKVVKGVAAEGPAFINVLSTCQRGWGFEPSQSVKMARLAVETCYWPLYEIEDGRWRLTHWPIEKLDVVAWLKPQKRFAHLFKPGNEHLVDEIQAQVDRDWERILNRCGAVPTQPM